MVDPVVNKGKVTVSTGYNSTATSIVLATGQGAELPDPVVDGAYNLPWWDSTNYNDPADDPNFEIVRVTGPAGTGDTKTIVRAQEGTAASNKNNADATYKMHLGVTAKTITDITDTLVLFNETATATNPTLLPNYDDVDTGIGSADTDRLSLIAGGVEGHRMTEEASVIVHILAGTLNDIAMGAGQHIVLPLHNDAATPSLAFGDGDSGFFESGDDHLKISIAGLTRWQYLDNSFKGNESSGPLLENVNATATIPNICPVSGDPDTGMGRSGIDSLSLIAGGVEALRLTESGGSVAISGAVVNVANGVSQLVAAPAAANSTGTAGQIAYDASFFYVCIATDTWERVGIASW